jgi:GGDEF domain-containing protein
VTPTLLLYWFPVFFGVAVAARGVPRRTGCLLGMLCAGLWAALVQVLTGPALWNAPGLLVFLLCGGGAIVLIGYWGTERVAGVPRPLNPAGPGRLPADDIGVARRGAERSANPEFMPLGFTPDAITTAFTQFDAWVEVHRYTDDPWTDFDEFLRSTLFHWVGATHVRTYRLLSEDDQLIPLRELDTQNAADLVSARRGVAGYVATTGHSFVAGDPTHGRLLDALQAQYAAAEVAPAGPESAQRLVPPGPAGPVWCFAVSRGPHRIGVITVEQFAHAADHLPDAPGAAPRAGPWSRAQLRLVELVVAHFWNALTEVCRGRAAVTTDPGSSGLTRKAFFEVGREVLADAYRQGEPVVVAVIALEGVRMLDDEGHWEMTDELRTAVSGVIKQRLRADDRLGRFDDSRFVLLLRRVDSELATLIAKELMERLVALPALRGPHGARVALRCGLAGSGAAGDAPAATRPSLERLVTVAMEACRHARQAATLIASDLDLPRTQSPGDPSGSRPGLPVASCGARSPSA